MTIRNYERDQAESVDPSPISDRRYSNGRVAWAFESGIRVTDLESGRTHTVMMPDRDKTKLWNLSERYLVATGADT